MPLLTSARLHGATISVRVAGEIDLATEPELWREIVAALMSDGITSVVIDLGDATFMDCHGLSALIRGRNLAATWAKTFTIANPPATVCTLLQLTHTLSYLTDPATIATEPAG